MSSRMNFDDSVSDKFEFQIGGKDFDFIYPTLDQMKPFEKKVEKINKSKDSKEIKELNLNNIILETAREFVVPVGHEEKLEDILNTVPLNVSRKLNQKLVELLLSGE